MSEKYSDTLVRNITSHFKDKDYNSLYQDFKDYACFYLKVNPTICINRDYWEEIEHLTAVNIFEKYILKDIEVVYWKRVVYFSLLNARNEILEVNGKQEFCPTDINERELIKSTYSSDSNKKYNDFNLISLKLSLSTNEFSKLLNSCIEDNIEFFSTSSEYKDLIISFYLTFYKRSFNFKNLKEDDIIIYGRFKDKKYLYRKFKIILDLFSKYLEKSILQRDDSSRLYNDMEYIWEN